MEVRALTSITETMLRYLSNHGMQESNDRRYRTNNYCVLL